MIEHLAFTDIALDELADETADALSPGDCGEIGYGDSYFGRAYDPPCRDKERKQEYTRGFARGLIDLASDRVRPDLPPDPDIPY